MEDADQAIRDGTIFRHPWIEPDKGRCFKILGEPDSDDEDDMEGAAYSSDSESG